MLIFSIYCYVSVVGRVIGTGNKLDKWSGMIWGYHQTVFLPENEMEYKQFLTVVHVDSTDVGDDTTVFDLKPYFHRMHRGPDVSGQQWRPNPAKLD